MSFTLKSASPEFSQRQKSVFDQLGILEKNRVNTSIDQEPMETDSHSGDRYSNRKTQRSVTKKFRGKESIFKKPQNPAPKNYIKRMPDFKINPHKWTKYSLEDVKDEDMSEASNTRSALSFLKQLNERKKLETGNNESDGKELPGKIIFRQISSIPKIAKEESEPKPSFRSSKVVMPEYVVGQKMKKEKKNKKKSIQDRGKEIKLGHLVENDDDEEET